LQTDFVYKYSTTPIEKSPPISDEYIDIGKNDIKNLLFILG
jgi:hypothetical protein